MDNDNVFSVAGNHERMFIEAAARNFNDVESYAWLSSDGLWANEVSSDDRLYYASLCADLPLIISVGTGENRFNVVHAEILNHLSMPVDDQWIDKLNNTTCLDSVDIFTWGRAIAHGHVDRNNQQTSELSKTFCGHTGFNNPVAMGRQVFLDGGSWVQNIGAISFIDAKTNQWTTTRQNGMIENGIISMPELIKKSNYRI